MSLFGEHLRALIDHNEVNIYGLAKSSGLERTAIHKIITGGRIPSDEYVNKLADAMPLSPEERHGLLESFNISKIGEFRHNQRLQVKRIIESIAFIEKESGTSCGSVATSRPPFVNANRTAIGQFAVNSLVKSVIEDAVSLDGAGGVDFIVPESYQYFYHELLIGYLEHPSFLIRHIVPFSKKKDFLNDTNINLSILSHVLPFAFAPGSGYSPYYHYREAHDAELTQAMPYFIITSSKKLVLLSGDFNRAALICDSDIVEMYCERFASILERSEPLIRHIGSTVEFLDYCLGIEKELTEHSYWIEPEPCIAPLVTDEMIEAQVRQDIPGREEFVNLACRHFGALRENRNRIINVCTTEGLYRVINTGYIYNAPKAIMHPLSSDSVLELLHTLLARISEGKVTLLFTDPSKITMPQNTLVNINKKTGIIFVLHDNEGQDFRAVSLSEESIIEAFADFADSIESSGLVYGESESLAALKSIISDI